MTTRRKYCKQCDTIKPIDGFYRAGKSYQTRCKPCHNTYRQALRLAKPKPPRLNGFQKLPQETRDEIMKYYNTMPLTTLAKRVNVNRNTMATWKRKGYLD